MKRILFFTVVLVLGFISLKAQEPLKGQIIGTEGSWFDSGSTVDKLFDNDLETFFNVSDEKSSIAWAALDFGEAKKIIIKDIKYCPRLDLANRMINCKFYGAHELTLEGDVLVYSDSELLFTVTEVPENGVLTSALFDNDQAFRYALVVFPEGSWANCSEIQVFGQEITSSAKQSINKNSIDLKSYTNRDNGVTVSFKLQTESEVGISIYDMAGRLVHSQATKSFKPDLHLISTDNLQLRRGLHIVKLNVNKTVYTDKIIVN